MSRRSRTYIDLNLNPVRKFRRSQHLTIDAAAIEAQVHIQTWYLAERGACREIPAGVLDFMLSKNPSAKYYNDEMSGIIQREFLEFQTKARQKFWEIQGDRILARVEELRNGYTLSNPANFLEVLMGVTHETSVSFAKNLCVAPTVVAATLNGRRQKLPKEIFAALVDAGWPPEKIVNTGVRL